MYGLYAACGRSFQSNAKMWSWIAFATCGWATYDVLGQWMVSFLLMHRSHWSTLVGSSLPWLFHSVVTTRNTTYLSNPTRCTVKLLGVDIGLWRRCWKLIKINPWFYMFRVIIKNPLFIACTDFMQKMFFPELWKQSEWSVTPLIFVFG